MVTSEQIERAERTLAIVYEESSTPRQLEKVEVEIVDFNKWLQYRTGMAQERQPVRWRQTDPLVHQSYNTLLMHFFITGLVIGRAESRDV